MGDGDIGSRDSHAKISPGKKWDISGNRCEVVNENTNWVTVREIEGIPTKTFPGNMWGAVNENTKSEG